MGIIKNYPTNKLDNSKALPIVQESFGRNPVAEAQKHCYEKDEELSQHLLQPAQEKDAIGFS